MSIGLYKIKYYKLIALICSPFGFNRVDKGNLDKLVMVEILETAPDLRAQISISDLVLATSIVIEGSGVKPVVKYTLPESFRLVFWGQAISGDGCTIAA